MKILIEESVLRQALETFTHCYAETDRRINERAKLLVELRTSLDAAEKVEPVAWIITTDNTNLHQLDPNRENNWLAFDVNQFKNDSARALVISNTQPLYLHPAHVAALEAASRIGELERQLVECQRDGEEQARLLGMSGSREAKLLSELEQFRAACQMALDALESCINDPKMRHTDTVHYATQDAHAKLREVLK